MKIKIEGYTLERVDCMKDLRAPHEVENMLPSFLLLDLREASFTKSFTRHKQYGVVEKSQSMHMYMYTELSLHQFMAKLAQSPPTYIPEIDHAQ